MRRRATIAALTASVLLATACTDGVATRAELTTGVGVTDAPCPEAVHDGTGCIYLGTLTDLSGPFAHVGAAAADGSADFWRQVNEEGGVGGFEVDVLTYRRDTASDLQTHTQAFYEVEAEVLALAASFGTAPTDAIVADLDAADIVTVPLSRWSGWLEVAPDGLLLEVGAPACLDAAVGLDWAQGYEGEVDRVQTVALAGQDGEDHAAGVARWAAVNEALDLGLVTTTPGRDAQAHAVEQVLAGRADRVLLDVGPEEALAIVVGALDRGFGGRFLLSAAAWDPALVEEPTFSELAARAVVLTPVAGPAAVSPAHDAMREAYGDQVPASDHYTWGWVSSYPLYELLEAAVAAGDLTRTGLRSAVDGLTVAFGGAIPEVTYGEPAGDRASRAIAISLPDAEQAPGGLRLAAALLTGETAVDLELTFPCAG